MKIISSNRYFVKEGGRSLPRAYLYVFSRWVGGTEQMLMQSKYFKKMHFIKFCDVVAEIRMLTEILTLFI